MQRSKPQVTEKDFELIAEVSLKKIDPHNTIATIVLPDDVDPRARKALARVHPVIASAQLHTPGDLVLPNGYFRLLTFNVDLEGSMFEGQLGPVTSTLTKANLADCGKIYSVPFFLRDADWYTPNYKVSSCDERRQWWPVDEAPPTTQQP